MSRCLLRGGEERWYMDIRGAEGARGGVVAVAVAGGVEAEEGGVGKTFRGSRIWCC